MNNLSEEDTTLSTSYYTSISRYCPSLCPTNKPLYLALLSSLFSSTTPYFLPLIPLSTSHYYLSLSPHTTLSISCYYPSLSPAFTSLYLPLLPLSIPR